MLCDSCKWGYEQTGLFEEKVRGTQREVENQSDIILQLETDNQLLKDKLDKQIQWSLVSSAYSKRFHAFSEVIRKEIDSLRKDAGEFAWPNKDETK